MNLFRIILFPVLLLVSSHAFSQDCKDFYKSKDCYVYVPLDRDFQLYNQAKSAYVEIGKPTIFKVVLYGKKDFIVGICAGDKYYRQIRFRIIDGITHTILYDNKDFDFIESFGFTVEKTQPLDLEVTVMSKEKAAQSQKVCLGIQILWSNVQETPSSKK
ncbi:MAG TPA: hypothetical protein VIH57_19680 [Bacteroidales bacterium]